MATKQLTSPKPKVACEIGADRVIAARGSAGASSMEIYSNRRLPAGTLSPGLASPNVLQAEALRQALSGVLTTVAGKNKDVIVVIPDAAARVLLLDFESLPDKQEEAAAIIRFRVKKSLPFDVEHAALSYHVGSGGGMLKVVAALSPLGVVQEYEAAVRDCGFSPGVVVPSTLAALGLVEADRPTMVVKVDPNTASVAIVNGNDLILLRTLDRSARDVSAQEIAAQLHPSMVFYEDTYSARIEQVLLTGLADIDQLNHALQSEIGISVNSLDSANADGESLGEPLPKAMLTAVGGALLG